MKIQVTQTLPNGQVTQQVMSREGAEVLKIQAQPGAKLSFNVEAAQSVEDKAIKSKTGDIKKVGNNLVLESEGEQLVEVTDFYSTAGASVGDVGWNYAVTDAGVMTATPEAQAMASDIAVSESGTLSPGIAPGWLLAGGVAAAAVLAGGGSSVVPVSSNVVSGVITAGPLVAGHGLSVVMYKADGITVLGTATVDASGKFSLDVGTYTGVIVAKVVDSSTGADFKNEADNQNTDLTAALFAVGVMTSGALVLNINPLTTIAGQLAGVAADGSTATGLTATTVDNANKATASAFGLTDVTTTTPDTTNDGTTSTNAIGAVLAALSGMDSSGGQQATINTLKSAITQTAATGVLSVAQQAALIVAAAAVEASAGATGLTNTLSDTLAAKGNTNASFTINDIDTGLTTVNNIIDATEIAGAITLSGTVATGTTAVSLSIAGGASVAATVSGTTWTYTIPAGSAAAAFGADGAKSVVATAIIGTTNPTTATATRLFVVNATDDAPTAITLGGVTTTMAENAGTTPIATHIKVADIAVLDDGMGTNTFAVTGTDAAHFEIVGTALYIKAGEVLNYEAKASYAVTVTATGGATPGAVSTNYTLALTNVNEAPTVTGSLTTATAVVNQVYSLNMATYFSDVDAGALTGGTYSATGLGNGLSIDATTGVISGTALANAAAAPVVVKFTDAGGLFVTQTFNLQAVTAPVVQGFTVVDNTPGVTTKGKSGEALTFVVTMSEEVTSTAGLTAHFRVNGQDVTATSAAVTNSKTITFTGGVVPATGDGTDISLTSLAAASGAITGNLSNQTMVAPTAGAVTFAGYTVDNTAPTVTATYTVNENTATDTALHTVTLVGTDANGPVTFSGLTGADAAKFTLSGSTLTFAGQANYEVADDAGANHVYDVSVIGTDAVGKTTTQAVTITLTDINEAPVVSTTAIADPAVVTGSTHALTSPIIDMSTYFTDPEAHALTYTLAAGAPSWLAIDSATGKVYNTTAAPSTAAADLPVTVDAFDGVNHVTKSFQIDVVAAPKITNTAVLDGQSSVDVTSNFVFKLDQAVDAFGTTATKYIRIKNDANTVGVKDGYKGEQTAEDILIDVHDTTQVTVSTDGLTVTVNPTAHLDLSNNYHIEVDAGAFVSRGTSLGSVGITDSTTINFSTVTPADSTTAIASITTASLSKNMSADGLTMTDGKYWVDIEDRSNPNSTAQQIDAGSGATNKDFVFVFKDYDRAPADAAATNPGITTDDFFVRLFNFGYGDLLYVDSKTADTNLVNLTTFTGSGTDTLSGAGTRWKGIVTAGTSVTTGTETTNGGALGGKIQISLLPSTDVPSDHTVAVTYSTLHTLLSSDVNYLNFIIG